MYYETINKPVVSTHIMTNGILMGQVHSTYVCVNMPRWWRRLIWENNPVMDFPHTFNLEMIIVPIISMYHHGMYYTYSQYLP